MNKYCIDLDFGIDPIPTSLLTSLNTDQYVHVFSAVQHMNPEFIVLMSKLGIVIDHIEFFVSKPNYFTPIHRDVTNIPTESYDFIKLNYVFGGTDSLMKWYEILNDAKPYNSVIPNNQQQVYVTSDSYRINDLALIHEQTVKFPSLVQVGIPHNVQNTNELRVCLCVVPLKDGKRITMSSALEIFKDYIV